MRLDSKGLTQQIALLSDDPPDDELAFGKNITVQQLADHVLVDYATEHGDGVAVYAWNGKHTVTRINLTRRGPNIRDRLAVLSTRLFQPTGVKEPLLVVQMSNFWYTSCWGQQRFRLFAASGDPYSPKVLMTRNISARKCEFDEIEIHSDRIRFGYAGSDQVFDDRGIPRGYNLDFEYDSGKLVQRFASTSEPQDVVSDWLTAGWSLAREGTAPGARASLEREHARLAKAIKAARKEHDATKPFSSKTLPATSADKLVVTVYCADPHSTPARPCTAWSEPVDFYLQKQAKAWRIQDVKLR